MEHGKMNLQASKEKLLGKFFELCRLYGQQTKDNLQISK